MSSLLSALPFQLPLSPNLVTDLKQIQLGKINIHVIPDSRAARVTLALSGSQGDIAQQQ